jgi:glycosyltransferase involved in cell wall biosynthesis
MNILWLSNGRLLPVDSGGRIRTTNTLRALRNRHEMTVFSLYRSRRPDEEYSSAFREEFRYDGAIWLGNGVRSALAYRFPNAVTTALALDTRGNRSVRKRIADSLESKSFDVAVCDFLFAAPYFPTPAAVPSVLHQHNVESALMASIAATRSPGPARLVDRWSVRRWSRFEAAQVRRFDHTIAVSEDDAAALRAMAPGAHVTAIGTGVDLEEYYPAPLPGAGPPLVMFTGTMSYAPNIDAVRWFVREMWPAILDQIPEARFRIVGRNPAPAVQALASASVEVTGRVESTGDELRRAWVVVVPLRAGSGTRLKIFEAMAIGRPVVSTALGAAGLDVHPDTDIVFAEDPPSFVREVVDLLRNRSRAQAIATAASSVGVRHSWDAVGRQIEAVLEETVARYRTGPAI